MAVTFGARLAMRSGGGGTVTRRPVSSVTTAAAQRAGTRPAAPASNAPQSRLPRTRALASRAQRTRAPPRRAALGGAPRGRAPARAESQLKPAVWTVTVTATPAREPTSESGIPRFCNREPRRSRHEPPRPAAADAHAARDDARARNFPPDHRRGDRVGQQVTDDPRADARIERAAPYRRHGDRDEQHRSRRRARPRHRRLQRPRLLHHFAHTARTCSDPGADASIARVQPARR